MIPVENECVVPESIPECVYEADWLLVSHAHHDHIDDAFPLMRRNPKMRTNVLLFGEDNM